MTARAARLAPSVFAGLDDWLDTAEIGDETPALQRAAQALADAGIDLDGRCWWRVEDAILITEAVNLAAKVIDEDFYALKPDCVRECVGMGADGGWRGGIFYLYHPAVGVASFHDPFDQIEVDGSMGWPFEWSGVYRQEQAFDLLVDRKALLKMRFATAPGDLGERCRSWLWQAKPRHKLP